jgi:hypothetical protein
MLSANAIHTISVVTPDHYSRTFALYGYQYQISSERNSLKLHRFDILPGAEKHQPTYIGV